MNKIFLAILFALFLLPVTVLADTSTSCSSIYGAGCPTGAISINKTIKNPTTGELVDTLGSNGPHFLPNQTVNFRLQVKNIGSADLNNIQIQDRFPDFVDFVSGTGNFDPGSRTLNFSLDTLKPGEFRNFDIVGKISSGNSLPSSGLSCVTNYAQATVDKQFASDTSVFCIETQVLAATAELPKTGPASGLLILMGSVLMLATSAFFYKKARA